MKQFFYIFLLLIVSLFLVSPAVAFTPDNFKLSKEIARSLLEIKEKRYSTIAFSRIQGTLPDTTINELIDYTNVSIVKERRFRVIDRSRLQMILKEQKYNLSEFISPDTYKELGKLLGVDLFVYGWFYDDELVLKALDVESSEIVWAQIFLMKNSKTHQLLRGVSGKVVNSFRQELSRLKSNKIDKVSFWDIQTSLGTKKVVDYITVALTREGILRVVDRENLELILKEQQLNLTSIIDEGKAKKMGELYGIDAFIYGSITRKKDNFIASLKMMNIYNGVIEWADLIQFAPDPSKKKASSSTVSHREADMVLVPRGNFILGNSSSSEVAFPERRILLGSFYIDRTEVSNKEYERFVIDMHHRQPPHWTGGRIPPGMDDLPVVNVSWNDAERYCKYRGKSLPTEAQWEKAFRGETGNIYPWSGNMFRRGMANTMESGNGKALSIESANQDVSPYGILNMAGNVREWVNSLFLPYSGNRKGYSGFGRNKMVIRGASWASPASKAVGWHREGSRQNLGWPDVGFRCVRTAN